MDRLRRPRTDILAFTMPGFATSAHTKNNAILLMGAGRHVGGARHPPGRDGDVAGDGPPFARGEEVYDVTFENVQGMRTDYLFRIANQRGSIVLGTGDLSELALGWCTYGVGDQMSHYWVNAGVPKTLMQHLIRWVVSSGQFEEHVGETLMSILATEITPGLIPAKEGAAVHPGADRAVLAPGLQPLPPAALGLPPLEGRVPVVACLARRRGRRLARGYPAPSAWPTTSRRSGAGWRCSCGASSPTSSNGRPCPTGPRSRLVVRSPPG